MEWVLLGVVLLVVYGLIAGGSDDLGAGEKFFAGVLITLLVLLLMAATYKDGRKSGQVDALNGKIEYKLVTKVDSTRVWEEIEK